MQTPRFRPGNKVLHKRGKSMGVGTIMSSRIRDDHPVGGYWYQVSFDGHDPPRRDEFAEDTLKFSVLDQLANL